MTGYSSPAFTVIDRNHETYISWPTYEQPGTHWRYGWSADVLARVIEVASAQPFDQVLRKKLFEPLSMHATSFAQPGDDLSDLATMYTQDENGDLVKTAASSHTTEWISGGGGLISTSKDYMRFALMLWNEGEYQGQRILKPESVKAMHLAHVKRGVLEDMDIEGLGYACGAELYLRRSLNCLCV